MQSERIQLYKRGKKNKVLLWSIWVEEEDVKGKMLPVIITEAGQEDGKQKQNKSIVKKGTNIGKSNEKSPMDMAVFKMENAVKSRIEDNWHFNKDKIDSLPSYIYPMLANSNVKKIKYPVYVQPKLNGARCFSLRKTGEGILKEYESDPALISRQRNEFESITEIRNNVDYVFNVFANPDGEIYKHGYNFQQIISLLKKRYELGEHEEFPELCTADLEYWVYDLAIPGKTYAERKDMLDSIIPDNNSYIKKVETVLVNSWEEIKEHHDKWVSEGYEGIIIRDPHAEYGFNDRSDVLIKYKEFFDKEYKIIGYDAEPYFEAETGTIHQLILWKCETEVGVQFNVRPRGTFEKRMLLYNQALKDFDNLFFEKMLTVRYQEESKDGVPIFPVGIVIRDYE